MRRLVDVAEDQLALAAGVGGAHHLGNARRIENPAHHLELVPGAFVDHQRPLRRQHGQQAAPPVPPLRIDLVRLRQGGQVADGPRHHVAVPVQVAVARTGRAQHARNIARHRGLLGHHRNSSGIRVRHCQLPV